ncbi:MAG TPA: hypothetical protein PLB91_06410 [Spirochaetales bacterium]|nr:hypothetical protein [Spirochaetales bacterium]HRY56288.1 hypothetical protein [Spirochaetia bacterium]HRZ65373.1 hypothetical protein [Spirochaetia bacterium]
MKKKLVLLVLALAVGAASGAYASGPLGMTGIGVYGSVGRTAGEFGSGGGLTMKFGSFPVLGFQYDFEASRFNVSFDYYVIDAEGIGNKLSYFLGVGGFAGFGDDFDFGLRLPVGLQFWPIKKFELFLSPVMTLAVVPSVDLGIGAEFGLRIHL